MGERRYEVMCMTANIRGAEVKFEVEFVEPITDPKKLPRIRLTVDSIDAFVKAVIAGEKTGMAWKSIEEVEVGTKGQHCSTTMGTFLAEDDHG